MSLFVYHFYLRFLFDLILMWKYEHIFFMLTLLKKIQFQINRIFWTNETFVIKCSINDSQYVWFDVCSSFPRISEMFECYMNSTDPISYINWLISMWEFQGLPLDVKYWLILSNSLRTVCMYDERCDSTKSYQLAMFLFWFFSWNVLSKFWFSIVKI